MSAFEIIDEQEFKRSAPSPDTALPSVDDEGADDIEMQLCQWCGWCENPDHCVWGVQCPKCCAPQMQQCTAPDGRITGLHKERHDYANRRI